MDSKYYPEEIKSRLKMRDLIQTYFPGVKPRNNRIPCPIHGGKNYNFGFDGGIYHCFVCGAKGDVIRFVQDVFSVSFQDALEKLNNDFHLGLVFGRRMTLREQRESEERYQALLAERERQPLTREEILDAWLSLKRWTVDFVKSPKKSDAEKYARAVAELNYLDYVLDQHDADYNDHMKQYIKNLSNFGEVPLGELCV